MHGSRFTSMKIGENEREIKAKAKRTRRVDKAARVYTRLSERGLGPRGGGWNVLQAAHWAGLSEAYLRSLIRRKESGEPGVCFPFHRIGRRIVIPREGFMTWYNQGAEGSAV
jgi:hypothetical protein